MSVEALKSFFDVGTVVLLFLTFAFGAGVLITGNVINSRQAKQLRQFDRDLTDAKTELGKQQERAAHAERDVAEAKKAAGDADAKAEGFRRDIATANERAADANKVAEGERLARVRIEEKLAGWKLDGGAQQRIISKIKQYEKTPFDLGTNPNELTFMETMDSILVGSGWTRQIPSSDNPLFNLLLNGKARINYVSGIYIEIAASQAAKVATSSGNSR